jgi:two-component system sensor histidine kinase KdpD
MNTQRRWMGYAWAVGTCVACTLAGLAMYPRFDLVNIAMVYMLAVVVIALRQSRGAAAFVAALSVAAFDFVFVPPAGTFTVDDVQYLLTFVIMLAVGLIISGLVADVRRQAQAQAQAALAVEAETERIRGTLLASISHDLRTPLAVISGASSSLAERGERMSSEERAALAQSVYQQARDMSEQVSKVLQMTRLESGAITPARDWVALSEIAESVIGRLGERLASHRLIVLLPPDLPLVHVDATLIEQALGNLLENAARHTPPGTVVQLRIVRNDDEVIVSVEDFGPGLSERDLDRVFAKFSRAGGESTAGGVGLGLAICRAIVRLHGGRAWAEQLPGGFTAFRFSLPLEPVPAVPAENAA